MYKIFRVSVMLMLPFFITACNDESLLAIGATSYEEVSSRDGLRHRKLNVPEWATEFTITANVEYGDIYFALSSEGKVALPFDEAVVDCVGNALSSNDTASSCVITDPKPGAWYLAYYGVDPENKFTLEISGELDWSWRYEVVNSAGDIVRDKVSGLEWQRCSVGEVWNNGDQSCDGTAIKAYGYEAQSYAGGGFRVPTLSELRSLVHCRTGEPGYFLEEGETCVHGGNGSLGVSVALDIFPYSVLDYLVGDQNYWTSSKNINPSHRCNGSEVNWDNCFKVVIFTGGRIVASSPGWGDSYENKIRLVRESVDQ